MERYQDEFNFRSPILLDKDASVGNAYGVWSHPTTFFINRKGMIVGRALGGRDWTSKTMTGLIQYLLDGKI